MTFPVLYTYRRCPYAMRARMALWVAQQKVALREIVLRDKPPALLAASPKGTVPVLVLPDGRVLEQSLDIMRWALLQQDPQGWLRQGDAAEGEALMARNDGPFKSLLDAYKYPERHPACSQAEWRDRAIDLHLGPLNARLQSQPYLLGSGLALADVALFPFVRQFVQVDIPGFEASGLVHLNAWLQGLLQAPFFLAVMDKLPPWQPEQPPLYLDPGAG